MKEEDQRRLRDDFQNRLQHAIMAYRYFDSAIPEEAMFVNGKEVKVGNILFRKAVDAFSMRIALGWAFFVRLEAILEAFVMGVGIKLSQEYSLFDYLVTHHIEFTEDQANGLRLCRELRNTLHHGDGDPSLPRSKPSFLHVDPGNEPQLLKEHIERFYALFTWLGEVLPRIL